MNTDDMTCQELVALLTDYLELSLTPDDRQRLEAHLHICLDCRTYLDQMRRTIQLVGTLRESVIAEPERARLLQTFQAWSADR